MMGALLPKSVGVGDGRHQSVPRAVVLIHDIVITWLFTDTRRLHDGKTLWRQEPGWSRKIIPRFPSPRITSSDPLHADKAVRHLTNPHNLDDSENRRCVDGIRNTTRLSFGFLIWSDYYQHKTQGLIWPARVPHLRPQGGACSLCFWVFGLRRAGTCLPLDIHATRHSNNKDNQHPGFARRKFVASHLVLCPTAWICAISWRPLRIRHGQFGSL